MIWKVLRPDPIGALDIVAGALLLYTVSPLPTAFADAHAVFLMIKGGISMIRSFPPILPVYIFGAAADVISAAILLTGQPPILVGYKEMIAAALFIKGLWSLVGFMG